MLRLRPATAAAIWQRVQHSLLYAEYMRRYAADPARRTELKECGSQANTFGLIIPVDFAIYFAVVVLFYFFTCLENLFLFDFGNDSTISALVDKVRYFIEAFFFTMPCPVAAGISSADAWPKTFQRKKKKI